LPEGARKVTHKPIGLGRGLDSLLGPRLANRTAAVRQPGTLPLERLQPGKYQPRTRMDESALYELAESIRSQGVMQPVLVRPVGLPEQERYEIIAGERRFRAARLAGLTEVPVLVRDVGDEAAAAMALIENIQREDLNPLEQARGLQRLVCEFGLTHERAAQAVGRSRSAATNLLRLLQLAQPVQDMLMAGDLEMGHARALLVLEPAQQILAATKVASRKLSVRETERFVTTTIQRGRKQPPLRASAEKPRDLVRLEEQLADRLASAVEIRIKSSNHRGDQGEIAIAFSSLEELDGLLERLGVRA
jgi:ParB family chromosome partitioning protein